MSARSELLPLTGWPINLYLPSTLPNTLFPYSHFLRFRIILPPPHSGELYHCFHLPLKLCCMPSNQQKGLFF